MQVCKIFTLLAILFFLPSCSSVARTFSKPTYWTYSADKIQLDKKNKINNVFFKKSPDDKYGIQKRATDEIEMKLRNNGINIVSNIDYADYILSLKIRHIAVDVGYEIADSVRQKLIAKETNYPYIFDNNNLPHIDNGSVNFTQTSKPKMYRRFLPATLYTMLGGGLGFTIGFVVAGSTAPFAFGVGGAFILGGTTYITYDTFRKTGVIVSYDIIVEERNKNTIQHNRKTVMKKSANSSDETYYSYSDKWNTLTSKNIIIAIGSRALLEDMIKNISPMISNNVVDIFPMT